MAVVSCAFGPRAAAAACFRVDGAMDDQRTCGRDDERDTRSFEREDQTRAELDAAVAELARRLPRGVQERFAAGSGTVRHPIQVRLPAVIRNSHRAERRRRIIKATALREGNCIQPEYSSSLVCAIAIEWLL